VGQVGHVRRTLEQKYEVGQLGQIFVENMGLGPLGQCPTCFLIPLCACARDIQEWVLIGYINFNAHM